jgi:two-component system, cell cycle response regulator
MPSASVIAPLRVALLGFSDFERSALVSYLRLSGTRVPAYVEADSVAAADYLIADADHTGTLDQVLGADRASDTIFIGSLAPDGALAWMMRPIDPMQVFRDLDAAVVLRRSRAQALLPAATRTVMVATPEAAAAKPAVQTPPASAPRPTKSGPPRRIDDLTAPTSALLVDDSEVALRFLERQLQALGLRTETASDSQRALALLGTQTYDAVFLDVELGANSELDGLGLCQHIKRQLKRRAGVAAPVVVMVSAHTGTTDRVRGTFAGCDAYLAKPLDDELLRRSLRALGLRMSAPVDTGHSNSRPGNLLSRPMPLDRPG